MSIVAFSETTETIAYGLLSSRVSHVLTTKSHHGDTLDQDDLRTLKDGLDLLDKFILGSRLVEGDEFKDELLPTPDSLMAFQYAMTTLKALEGLRKNETVSQILRAIHGRLKSIIDAGFVEAVDEDSRRLLREFFTTLASMLYADLVRQRQEGSTFSLPEPRSLDLQGHAIASLA